MRDVVFAWGLTVVLASWAMAAEVSESEATPPGAVAGGEGAAATVESVPAAVAETPAADETIEQRFARLEAEIVALKAAEQERAEETPDPTDFRVYFKDGVAFETLDKNFQMKLGGRIHADAAWFSESSDLKDAVGKSENGFEFRRARLAFSGLVYQHVEYKIQFDFGAGRTEFKDVYMGLTKLPYVNVRVGHFKEPASLELINSSNDITFMERSLISDFGSSEGRNTGAMLHNAVLEERVTWAVGAFRETGVFGNATGNGKYAFTGRLTGLPWYEDGGRRLIHLGASASYRMPTDDEVRYRQRPEAHLAQRYVDTGDLPTESEVRASFEAATVLGPLSLQGEYACTWMDGDGEFQDSYLYGFYGQASYFLTGEHRPYKKSAGCFTRVRPKTNVLFEPSGLGAWELAVRYSYLNLNDDAVRGGVLSDITAGLNWYMNGNTRVMFNYVHALRHSVGDADIFQVRFQIAF